VANTLSLFRGGAVGFMDSGAHFGGGHKSFDASYLIVDFRIFGLPD
jgi:hypothetical protein